MPPRKASSAAPEKSPASTSSKSTISGHQGKWVPFSEWLVTREIWSSRKMPSDAWRVYWWMNNRMTGSVKYEDDPTIYGIVAGGNPVSFREIGKTLHPNDPKHGWRSIQRAVNWLTECGLIIPTRAGRGQEYRYKLADSIRQFPLVTVAGSSSNETGELEFLDESKSTSFNIEGDDELA